MYKVLLVDDEYMVTEGLKRLIPFDKWDMEVVATASHADEALEYVQENPVDVIISDVNMPDKTGLDMIREMKEILPDAAYILLSGYQEFDYVKRAMNLSVVDYLVKPVDKVELGNLLEKIAGQLGERGKKSQTLSQELDEAGFVSYLGDKENWWIGLSKEKQGSFTIPYYVLGQDWQIFISDQPLDGLVVTPFEAPYQEHFERWKLNAEKTLFINPVYLGQLIKRETDSTFAELLNKQRIKAAQQLLLSTSDSIEDICYAVGYSNLGYFYKVFRKLCGKSPKAYRKQVETIL